MGAAAVGGPHIQAKGYRRGRAYGQAKKVSWLVIHTAEGATDETSLGSYFRGTTNASSNAGIGQDGGYATYVNYQDTAWANPPLNEEADSLELCGFARWGRADWLKQARMLDTCARWIAWRCAVRGIPIRYVARPAVGSTGVTGHRDINAVYKQSSHWDPGPQFPWDVVIAKAQSAAGTKPPPVAAKPPVVATGTYVVKPGDSYWRIAQSAYRDGRKWPTISAANKNIALHPGMKIVVPKLGAAPNPVPPPPRIDLPAWPGYGYVVRLKRNAYVKILQDKLRRIGFAYLNPSGATGFFGDETREMVRAFQRTRPVLWAPGAKEPDGVCGPKTWAAIDAA